jgi:hypothetical protein
LISWYREERYGKDVFFFEIPPSAIKAVIFDYRAASQLQDDLREVVTTNTNLEHVAFRRAVRDANGHIEIVPALPAGL